MLPKLTKKNIKLFFKAHIQYIASACRIIVTKYLTDKRN